ncbi:MAG: cysteine--tRNA ligase [Deltaproteobacteria bacterium]|nr:cysteine--tRNA ligase [Deltaproteobacteria bacterium]
MPLFVHNTLTRKKEEFVPNEPGVVRMYVCGPTVYDSAHMGHARSAVVFDVVYRHLVASGYKVTYVRNFTDVDDKIIRRAAERGEEPNALANRYIDEFHSDMDALGVLRPTFEPKATEFIGPIIEVVNELLKKGAAYVVDGDVYFRVEAFPAYGRLSGRKLADMEVGARVDIDERKESPFDFALWKSAKPGEPSWESPWGPGRPGWHIECSAMSRERLGHSFDIHGGGSDLIFPHHENEIAQSEAAFGGTFVKYWMHNGFVNVNSEKMSKSLGNFFTVGEALKKYHPESIRLFLLSKHYRGPVDFSDAAMNDAASGLDRLYACLLRGQELTGHSAVSGSGSWANYPIKFREAMDDDFNTAAALGVLFEAVRYANRLMDEAGKLSEISILLKDIREMGGLLGLFSQNPAAYFESRKEAHAERSSVDTARIERLIAERAAARKARDFKAADEVRNRLKEMGVLIEDGPAGTTWKFSD